MIIAITTFTRFGLTRHFTVRLDSLEVGLETVNDIANTGDTLLRVHILDENRVLALPIEAFDGQPLEEPILALEKEYKQILDQPLPQEATPSNRFVDQMYQHRDNHELYIARLEAVISMLQQHLLEARQNHKCITEQFSRLTANLERYQAILATAISRRAVIEHRLSLLSW